MSEAYQPENELQQERQTAAPYGNAQPYYQTMPSRRGSAAPNNTPREPSKVPCIVSFVTAICSFVCTLLTTFFLLDYLSAVFRFRSYVGEARDLGGVFAEGSAQSAPDGTCRSDSVCGAAGRSAGDGRSDDGQSSLRRLTATVCEKRPGYFNHSH